MEGMELSREVNWATCEGSLQNTVIFKPQIRPEEPEIESHPLLLRPSPGSGPCEITLRFRETLCELHSIYVRSTARVFELYNKLELNVENEYVCTARGELNVQNDDDFNCPRGDLDKDENAPPSQESPGGKSSETSLRSPEEIGSQPALTLQEQEIELTNEQNPSGIPDGNNNGELPNMLHEDSIEIPEELAKNDFHGSDEDNWIEVKFSGSLVMDSLGETGGSSQLQSLGDNENSECTTDWQMGLSVEDDDGKTSSHYYLDSYTQTKGASFHQKLTTEKVGNTEISEKCFIEKGEDTAARSEENSSPLHKNNLSKKAFYEATVEIVNARPCTSLTIRLLSLQDKSSVEIDEIRVYGLPVPAVTAGTETIGLSSGSSLLGSSFGGSLLAMLVPNMLQMSRVELSQRRDELFASLPNVRREREMSESGLSVPELSTSSSQPLTSTTWSMEDVGASAGGYLSSSMVPEKRLPTDLLLYEKKYPHSASSLHGCLNEVAENVEMDETNLKDSMGRIRTSRHKTDYTCERKERQVEIGGGTPASGGITSVNEQLPDRLSEPEVTDCFTQCCTKELKSNGVDEGIRERTSGEITLEHLLKRMDKLDTLCMRIEAYVHEALNNMERRLQLVESRQMLPNLSVPTKVEDATFHSGLSSLPNLCLNSLVSCPEILSVSNCKHIHGMGMPSQSCTEFHSSVSMSKVFLGSLADCSSACAASSSSVILLSHASHPVNSMDSEPESMHGLSMVEEPLNACLHVSPSDVILDKPTFDQQVISKEEIFLGNSQGADCAKEKISAGSVISGNYICEHPTPAKRPAPSIEEALAAALSAFSASISCPQIEATDTSTEAPCCSSELENGNVDDKDFGDSGGIVFDAIEGFSSHQVETTAVCTAALCGLSEVDITDYKDVCYDDIVFDTVEGVRYISQEGMDSVPYSSSKGGQDARHVLYRRSKIGDSQDDIAVNIKQTCKLGAEIMINQKREIIPSEDKIEGRLCNNEMALAGKDFDSVYVIQDTSTCRQECSMVHADQELLQPLERPEELECSKQWSKHTHLIIEEGHDLVVDKNSAFIPVTGKCESDILSIEGICSSLNNEARKAETSIESNNSKQSYDMPAMSKLHTDLPSLLDVSFTVSDTCQMRMPLEALLYNPTPEQHRETVCLQESTELGPLMNLSEPKRPHGLFFVEDEDLGDFIIPSLSTLIAPVSTGNREDQGMVPGAPPNFESLL